MTFQHQEPESRPVRVGAPGEAVKPGVERAGAAGRVVDHDQQRRVARPLGRALGLDEGREVAAVEEACLPLACRRDLTQLDREPRLAAARSPREPAHQHRPWVVEPCREGCHLVVTAE